jgi:hypothetical protein
MKSTTNKNSASKTQEKKQEEEEEDHERPNSKMIMMKKKKASLQGRQEVEHLSKDFTFFLGGLHQNLVYSCSAPLQVH